MPDLSRSRAVFWSGGPFRLLPAGGDLLLELRLEELELDDPEEEYELPVDLRPDDKDREVVLLREVLELEDRPRSLEERTLSAEEPRVTV